MITTVHNIISANSILNKILLHEFTGKQSFLIGRFLRMLNTEAEGFYKTREEVIKKYAEYDNDGNIIVNDGNVKIKEDKMTAFQEEINELLHTRIEIPGKKIPLSWLENVLITPQEMIALENFLDTEE